jgi:Protein of unknown function (DUF1778).
MKKDNQKETIIGVRVTPQERELLHTAAYNQGRTSLSAFMRQASLATAQQVVSSLNPNESSLT